MDGDFAYVYRGISQANMYPDGELLFLERRVEVDQIQADSFWFLRVACGVQEDRRG